MLTNAKVEARETPRFNTDSFVVKLSSTTIRTGTGKMLKTKGKRPTAKLSRSLAKATDIPKPTATDRKVSVEYAADFFWL